RPTLGPRLAALHHSVIHLPPVWDWWGGCDWSDCWDGAGGRASAAGPGGRANAGALVSGAK
ncbi:MAG: hypothetical protein ACYDAQ_11390, partial [Mycobacteriales bacterium]